MLADQTGSLRLFAIDVVLLQVDRLWSDTAAQQQLPGQRSLIPQLLRPEILEQEARYFISWESGDVPIDA
jgi:hypothetical protein